MNAVTGSRSFERLEIPRGCTFNPEDWEILARQWYPVALVRELADYPDWRATVKLGATLVPSLLRNLENVPR